jgi:predicted kinase
MSDAPPAPAGADRNLLFGILALQMDLISRDALIAAMHAWVLDKARPLGYFLRQQGALTADDEALLDALVHKHRGRGLSALRTTCVPGEIMNVGSSCRNECSWSAIGRASRFCRLPSLHKRDRGEATWGFAALGTPSRYAGGGRPMTPELIVFVGLQGAGKTSFYRVRFASTHDLASKDRFPNNRNPARRQRQLVGEALAAGRSVVVDNTNPTVEERAELIALARSLGAGVVGYYFESRLDDCLERNRRREGKARVPDVALHATRKRLCRPSLAEGFDRLSSVRLLGEGRFEVRDWNAEVPDDEPR